MGDFWLIVIVSLGGAGMLLTLHRRTRWFGYMLITVAIAIVVGLAATANIRG